MPGISAEYWDSPVFWYDDELRLNPDWFGKGTVDQDSTIFHEVSHGQGTDDEGANDYNNAHLIETLMYLDKEKWIIFTTDKRKADQECKFGGK
jgi:hypothetical protein